MPFDVAKFVRSKLIEQANEEPDKAGISTAALQHGLAVLLDTWGASWGIDVEGQIWRIEWGDDFGDPCPVSVETETHRRNAALYRGSLRYPELKPLVPVRPADAGTCPSCKGSGIPPGVGEFQGQGESCLPLCFCGGLGWLPRDTRIPGVTM